MRDHAAPTAHPRRAGAPPPPEAAVDLTGLTGDDWDSETVVKKPAALTTTRHRERPPSARERAQKPFNPDETVNLQGEIDDRRSTSETTRGRTRAPAAPTALRAGARSVSASPSASTIPATTPPMPRSRPRPVITRPATKPPSSLLVSCCSDLVREDELVLGPRAREHHELAAGHHSVAVVAPAVRARDAKARARRRGSPGAMSSSS